MPKEPFSSYRVQGYRLLLFHVFRGVQFGYLVGRGKPPLYAVRYRMYQEAGTSLREAVALVQAKAVRAGN